MRCQIFCCLFRAFAELTFRRLLVRARQKRLLHGRSLHLFIPLSSVQSLRTLDEKWERVHRLQRRRRVSSLSLSLMLHYILGGAIHRCYRQATTCPYATYSSHTHSHMQAFLHIHVADTIMYCTPPHTHTNTGYAFVSLLAIQHC